MEDSILLVVIGSIGTISIFVPISLSLPPSPAKLVRPDIPDSMLIDHAANLPEVKAYLATYSNSTVEVVRQVPTPSYGGLSPESITVFYSITRFAATGEKWNAGTSGPIEPYANLRVWFDPQDITVKDIRFVCSTKKSDTGQFDLRSDTTEYLRASSGYCWDDPDPPIITCTLENLRLRRC